MASTNWPEKPKGCDIIKQQKTGSLVRLAERWAYAHDPQNLIRIMPAKGELRRFQPPPIAGRWFLFLEVLMANRAVIVANGLLAPETNWPEMLLPGDLLIAADGGGRLFLAAHRAPHYLIGDFDSLAPTELDALAALGAQALQHPVRKDETDLELAVNLALDHGMDDILIFAGLGGRWDHTLANLMMLALPRLGTARLRLLDGCQELTLLRPGQTHRIDGKIGDAVSLIPVGGDAKRVTTSGLEYPLLDSSLLFGRTLGVSNQMNAPEATVALYEGLLICVVIHNA